MGLIPFLDRAGPLSCAQPCSSSWQSDRPPSSLPECTEAVIVAAHCFPRAVISARAPFGALRYSRPYRGVQQERSQRHRDRVRSGEQPGERPIVRHDLVGVASCESAAMRCPT